MMWSWDQLQKVYSMHIEWSAQRLGEQFKLLIHVLILCSHAGSATVW